MTNNQLDVNSDKVFCDGCDEYVDKNAVYKNSIRVDGTVRRCKICDWIDRHGGIPKLEGINDSQMKNILGYLLQDGDKTLNYISEQYGISLDECVQLWDMLHIRGKKASVECDCAYCNKQVIVFPNVFKKNKNIFCSTECYYNYKRENDLKGKDSPYYNRILTKCDNCGKEIEVIPFNYDKKNRDNESHNFCCQECYWEFRKKYYIGEKSNFYGYEPSEEEKEAIIKKKVAQYKNQDRLNTDIQIMANQILDELGYNYEREYNIEYYSIDNYLSDFNLMIEVMGDYWHCSPIVYKDKMNQIQSRTVTKDKQKHTYIKNHCDIEILYLWGGDIKKNINMCKELIRLYVSNSGALQNYHSFNWFLCDDQLILKNDIIIPYQNKSIDEYRHLITA